VPRDGAVIGIGLGEEKQALALVDHDVRVPWRKTARVPAHRFGGNDPGPNHGQTSPVPGTFPSARLNAVGAGRRARPSPLELRRDGMDPGQPRTPATRTATQRGAGRWPARAKPPAPAAQANPSKPQIRPVVTPQPPAIPAPVDNALLRWFGMN
jgi:hypothetical protein